MGKRKGKRKGKKTNIRPVLKPAFGGCASKFFEMSCFRRRRIIGEILQGGGSAAGRKICRADARMRFQDRSIKDIDITTPIFSALFSAFVVLLIFIINLIIERGVFAAVYYANILISSLIVAVIFFCKAKISPLKLSLATRIHYVRIFAFYWAIVAVFMFFGYVYNGYHESFSQFFDNRRPLAFFELLVPVVLLGLFILLFINPKSLDYRDKQGIWLICGVVTFSLTVIYIIYNFNVMWHLGETHNHGMLYTFMLCSCASQFIALFYPKNRNIKDE